jgi:hypothetical protein
MSVRMTEPKAFTLGKPDHVCDRELRYALGLPVSTTIVDCFTIDEVELAAKPHPSPRSTNLNPCPLTVTMYW